MWRNRLQYKRLAKWLVIYAVLVVAPLGLTAAYLRYLLLAFHATLPSLYPWMILWEGIGFIGVALIVTPSKETETTRPQQSYESTYFYLRSWFFRREQSTGYESLFFLAGVTLIGIGFYLLWLWNI
jgi:hypothetical protein